MDKNQFAPRELCERLQKVGCVSESGFYWEKYPTLEDQVVYGDFLPFVEPDKTFAFVQNDFTGATLQARKNAEIVWRCSDVPIRMYAAPPGVMAIGHPISYAHSMIGIDLSKETWWQYLERTMKKDLSSTNS